MKQKYEHTFMYFILIYIANLTYNDKLIFLSFIVEKKKSFVSNTTFLIHQFQFLTNVPKKNLNKWNLFQVWSYFNMIARPPHQVI